EVNACDSQVFAKQTGRSVESVLGAPEVVVLLRVRVNRLVLATVHGAVGLVVADKVHTAQRHALVHWLLPDPRPYNSAAQFDLANGADIDADNARSGVSHL